MTLLIPGDIALLRHIGMHKTKVCSTNYVWQGENPGTPSAEVLVPVESCQRGLVAQSYQSEKGDSSETFEPVTSSEFDSLFYWVGFEDSAFGRNTETSLISVAYLYL